MIDEFFSVEFIETSTTTCPVVVGVVIVGFYNLSVDEGHSCFFCQSFFIGKKPFSVLQYLYGSRMFQVSETDVISTATGVEAVVLDAHELEVVVLRSTGLQRADKSVVLVPVGQVLVEDTGRCIGGLRPVACVLELTAKRSGKNLVVGCLQIDIVSADTYCQHIEVKDIGVGHLDLLHVHLHHTEASGKVGESPVHEDAVDGFVAGH